MRVFRVAALRVAIVDRRGRATTLQYGAEFTTDPDDAAMFGAAHVLHATSTELRRHLAAGRLVEVASCS